MEKKLDLPLTLNKFLQKRDYLYQLDITQDWVKELFEELHNQEESPPAVAGSLQLNLKVNRKIDTELKDHVLLEGSLTTHYNAQCIRCLGDAPMDLTFEFNACIVPQALEKNPELNDQICVFTNGHEYNLYFYKSQELPLKDIVREHIYLNYESSPLHDTECKGLCQFCGENLNKTLCTHHSA
ncbi:MAG: DUF177 domain-containing protein [Bacteriovoracaceae bacterium]|nr:DUF177 domain-containing protein [Bacteriovoracaceae bacterium]